MRLHKVAVILVAVLSVSLAGCMTTPESRIERGVPYRLSQSEIMRVKAAVADNLRNPASAIFTEPFVASINSQGGIVVCGLVNGTNAYGGYVGRTPFLVVLAGNTTSFIGGGGSDAETAATLVVCEEAGAGLL